LVGEAAQVAQLDSHQVELHIQPHAISEPIEAALEDLQQALSHHPVEVAIPDHLPMVQIDPARIAEVVRQMLDNAGKYAPDGTPIRITAERRGAELVVSVADQGPGIDEFEQSMIFEKFYRGRNQRVSFQGTGMGLAIAKGIVELHGGTVGVTSQLGHGSVFYFALPVSS
jgi:two-component system sensor histidine kinase KdpD